jgi:lysophospholipase L1-like esterase
MPTNFKYKKSFFYVFMVFFSLFVVLVLGDILIRILSPGPTLYPRYKYSPDYGFLPYENIQMVHTLPGEYKFVYTTNEYGHRGKALSPSQLSRQKVIIVLGDSNSFGIGVNDGEEYPARLAKELGNDYVVMNLAAPAWGLTQEIRRYYDLGQLYSPAIVILQFAGNDPTDNFTNMVTTVEDSKFVFHTSTHTANWVKKYLSKSFLQKSQLYNFFRGRVFDYFANFNMKSNQHLYNPKENSSIPYNEDFYIQLLESFSEDLQRNGIRLLMIAMTPLEPFPYIKSKIGELHGQKKLEYIEVANLFEHGSDLLSKEGVHWGAKAHDIIGKNLAMYLKNGTINP